MNPAVAPAFAIFRNVRLQQDARLQEPLRRGSCLLRIIASSCCRSSALNRTTYRFTERAFAAIISSIAQIAMDKESLKSFPNSLKRATR